MGWEKSKALTPLKRDFLVKFFDRERRFYLSGGSALGIFYLQHRVSHDLDFFTQDKIDALALGANVRGVCEGIGAACENVTTTPDFFRFRVRRAGEIELLDFVRENVHQVHSEKHEISGIRVDPMEEIGVNKICALLGRGDIKDIVDLYFLDRESFHVPAHLEEARLKDAGVHPAALSYVLSETAVDELPEMMIEPVDLERLKAYAEDLAHVLAGVAFPRQ